MKMKITKQPLHLHHFSHKPFLFFLSRTISISISGDTMDSEQNIPSTSRNNEATVKTSNPKQTEAHTPQTEPKPTPTSDEASATQTSEKTEEIVAKVVSNIDAATEEDTAGDGGGKSAEQTKVNPLFFSSIFEGICVDMSLECKCGQY